MSILRLDGDSTGAVRATEAVVKGGKKIAAEFDAAGKSAKALERDLAKIVQSNEGPQERYNRKMRELGEIMFRTNMTLAQYTAQANRLRSELDGVGRSSQRAFGAESLASLRSYFLTFVGPAALVGLASRAISNYSAEISALAGKLEAGRGSMGQLAQLAALDKNPQAKMNAYMAEAQHLSVIGSMPGGLPQGSDVLFGLESAQILDPKDKEKIAKLFGKGVLKDPKDFAKGIAAVRMAYPGLTPQQVLARGTAAGSISPGEAEQVVIAAATAAEQMRVLGWGDDFALSATSLLSAAYGGPEKGADRLSQFGKQVQHHGMLLDPSLRGMDPHDLIERIGKQTSGGTDIQALNRILGNRVESIQAFQTMHNQLPKLRELTKLTGATGEDLVDRMLKLAESRPEIAGPSAAVSARIEREQSRLPATSIWEGLESMRDKRVAGRHGEGSGTFHTAFEDTNTWFLKNIFPQSFQEAELRRAAADPKQREFYGEQIMSSIDTTLKSLDDKTKTKIPSGRQTQP